ncbi:MAG: helix-turn-helix domain-containing protein [Bacteroidota bacterium]
MTERIRLLMEAQNLTASQFADRIHVQRSGLSHIMSGRNKASLDFVQKVLGSFPEVSPDWLINGTGPMIRQEVKIHKKPLDAESDQINMAFPGKGDSSEPVEQQQKNEETTEGKAITAMSDGRKAERVIIFYSDGTFSDYRPQ